tara:strand:- start:694 stop:879 length:186 start_codon:yes stop_codon:yes gene_type:complete
MIDQVEPFPVVIKNEDGTCLVSLPDGVQLMVASIDGAHKVVEYYMTAFERESASKRRIGFV